jgi:hypothetical protein
MPPTFESHQHKYRKGFTFPVTVLGDSYRAVITGRLRGNGIGNDTRRAEYYVEVHFGITTGLLIVREDAIDSTVEQSE